MYEKIKTFAEANGLQAIRPVHASVTIFSPILIVANKDLAGLP
jgi:hypothetical protein